MAVGFATLKSVAARLRETILYRDLLISVYLLWVDPKRQNQNFTPAGSLLSIHSAAGLVATRGRRTVHWWLFGVARHSRDQSSTALLVHDATSWRSSAFFRKPTNTAPPPNRAHPHRHRFLGEAGRSLFLTEVLLQLRRLPTLLT